ncbi:hypothetical protein [Streptomyces sp. TRM70350]|uniref:hypothetical protein n=1 Tax=Streptomyces sp. TRM70350 TaxID=2856165 RepID=UPI001C46D422|nr:hypothetical protein [Streptomyces sp. TRM70350]MBV7699540.1 hypothetical protein [Streptomyces sp. TRM70350]
MKAPPVARAGPSRRLPRADRVRKFANVLLCLVAVAGIGRSGTDLWRYWQARRQIDEACAGLVPPGRVLAPSPAGGTISHRVADEGTTEPAAGLPQDCEIFGTEAGETYGTDSGERWSFTGAVGALPADSPVVADDPLENLVDPYGRHTYPQQPLGGGITGVLTDSGVVVQLPCAEGKADGRPVGALWARAELMVGSKFTDHGRLTAHDRDILAETAVLTANGLAERLGCADHLSDPPQDIPALAEDPLPADREPRGPLRGGPPRRARRAAKTRPVVRLPALLPRREREERPSHGPGHDEAPEH